MFDNEHVFAHPTHANSVVAFMRIIWTFIDHKYNNNNNIKITNKKTLTLNKQQQSNQGVSDQPNITSYNKKNHNYNIHDNYYNKTISK